MTAGSSRALVAAAVAAAVLHGSPAAPAQHPAFEGRVTGVLVIPDEHSWGMYYEPGFPWEWAANGRRGTDS